VEYTVAAGNPGPQGTPAGALALLASAVSGLDVSVAMTDEPRAYIDGSTIAVPEHDPDAVVGLVIQAGLLALGSLTPEIVSQLVRARPATVSRYLVLEAARAARTPYLLPPRVAAAVLALPDLPESRSAAQALEIARGRAVVAPAPTWMGTLKPYLLRKRGAPQPLDDDPDAAGASALRKLLVDPNAPEADDDPESEASSLLEKLTAPVGGVSPTTKLLMKVLGSGAGARSSSGGSGADSSGMGVRTRARRTVGRALPGRSAGGVAYPGGPRILGERYPEWDWATQTLQPDWCTVHAFDPPDRRDVGPLAVRPDPRLRRELAKLGTAPQRRKHLREGDVIDDAALVEFEVQRRLGSAAEPRVYEARPRTARDLGVLVLLDATGSTAGAREGNSLFGDQRAVVHRLTASLEELGDRVATFAFNSRGRSNVRFLRVKEFDGRYDEAARQRLAAIEPGDYTRLGAAVRHGTSLLTRGAGTSHMLLVVVGDGLPFDEGYEDRYAREDSRAALREALLAGVGCVSVGVGTSRESEVDDVWNEVTHLHLNDGAELDRQVREVFGASLRLATARRRAPGGTRAANALA
jgi:nitric oxide reductase activation protein